MSSTDVRNEMSAISPDAVPVNMKLEVVVVPVSDVDRAKRFYQSLGWRLDADYVGDDEFRIVQLTPPGSGCSIIIGTGVTSATPGSTESLLLVVDNVDVAVEDLTARGVEVSTCSTTPEECSTTPGPRTACPVRIPLAALSGPWPRSAIPTGTAGSCKRSLSSSAAPPPTTSHAGVGDIGHGRSASGG
jgi:predicted enzyme related to lactoylglutathione lyase